MDYSAKQISEFSLLLRESITRPDAIIEAASKIIPFEAAFCVINKRNTAPLYVCDNYSNHAAKQAVQNYVKSTYLLNPVYNSFLGGLESGLYRMRDLAPDQWQSETRSAYQNITVDQTEEIGYLTQGWPSGLEELVLASSLSGGVMAEISFAQTTSQGGFSDEMIERLKPFVPLFGFALNAIWEKLHKNFSPTASLSSQLAEFSKEHLTPRENQVIQLVLKGHSGLSIGLNLNISLPTVKSHRKSAYAKLGIATQQELFMLFLRWQRS